MKLEGVLRAYVITKRQQPGKDQLELWEQMVVVLQ